MAGKSFDELIEEGIRNGNIAFCIKRGEVKFDICGTPIYSLDDIGGRCCKGETVHKDNLLECDECGTLLCRVHANFYEKKPYCEEHFKQKQKYDKIKGVFGDFIARIVCG